jgi:hypothetical protein
MEMSKLERLVFFHKTPALWNKVKNLPDQPQFNTVGKMRSHFKGSALDEEMKLFLETDVYFQMCKRICHEFGITEIHVVHGFMEEEDRNWSVSEQIGWSPVDEKTTYWSLTDPADLLGFMDSSIVFTRGNYPRLHQWLNENSLKPEHQFWFHYPATSLRFPHIEQFEESVKTAYKNNKMISNLDNSMKGMTIEHDKREIGGNGLQSFSLLIEYFKSQREIVIGGPYNLVLVDDKGVAGELQKAFPNSLIQTFTKPAIWNKKNDICIRKYDMIYCGTTLQVTKNHQCFIQLLRHLDVYLDTKLRIAIAGNKTDSEIFAPLFDYPFSNIELFDKGEVSREQLQSLFSESKTMIVTSGRDANPRVIQECLVHGARVLAINTLSDGLGFLEANPLLGSVLSSEPELWNYTRNGNLEFKPSIHLASLIAGEIGRSNFPDLVMNISRKKLSVEEAVKSLTETIKSFR